MLSAPDHHADQLRQPLLEDNLDQQNQRRNSTWCCFNCGINQTYLIMVVFTTIYCVSVSIFIYSFCKESQIFDDDYVTQLQQQEQDLLVANRRLMIAISIMTYQLSGFIFVLDEQTFQINPKVKFVFINAICLVLVSIMLILSICGKNSIESEYQDQLQGIPKCFLCLLEYYRWYLCLSSVITAFFSITLFYVFVFGRYWIYFQSPETQRQAVLQEKVREQEELVKNIPVHRHRECLSMITQEMDVENTQSKHNRSKTISLLLQPLGSEGSTSFRDYKKQSQLINTQRNNQYKQLPYDSVECSICCLNFEEGQFIKKLPNCDHSYHSTCIDQWLKIQIFCPNCKASIK